VVAGIAKLGLKSPPRYGCVDYHDGLRQDVSTKCCSCYQCSLKERPHDEDIEHESEEVQQFLSQYWDTDVSVLYFVNCVSCFCTIFLTFGFMRSRSIKEKPLRQPLEVH